MSRIWEELDLQKWEDWDNPWGEILGRDPNATFITEIEKSGQDVLRPALFWSGDFPSGMVRFWTGFRTIKFLGEVWNPSGSLLTFTSVQESIELRAHSLGIVLNGVPQAMVSLVEKEEFQGRESRLILAVLDSSGASVLSAIDLHRGDMDIMETDESRDTVTIKLSVEGPFIAMFRRDNLRNTPGSHKARFPDDTFFDFAADLVDREIILT